MRAVTPLALVLSTFLAPALAAQVDLSKVYASTLKHDELDPEPLEWVSSPEDVWTLASFDYEVPGRLDVALRASTLVIGRHERDALWAVVLPDKPTKLVSTLGGEGERIEHVWLRFHPTRLAALFPARTVRGQGSEEALLEAWRIAAHKVGGVWGKSYEKPEGEKQRAYFTGYRPVVPPEGALVLDMDTLEGTRRVFTLEPSQELRLRSAYLTQALPKAEPLERGENMAAFERASAIGARMQAGGLELEGASWEEHLKEGRKEFQRATSDLELARAVHSLLAPLRDPWLSVRRGEDSYPAWHPERRPINASLGGVQDILVDEQRTDSGIAWGRTPYGIGYVRCRLAKDEQVVTEFDEVLETLQDTWGLIVDLRFGLDGESERVLALAGRFVEEKTPFGEQSAGGAGGGDSTPLALEPRGAWTYGGRVYALIGAGTGGEAERLALAIAALEKGETMGEPSAGIGLGARWEMLPGGVDVFCSEGSTFDTRGQPLSPGGLVPDVEITAKREEFTDKKDPILWHALEVIYLVPHAERLQAKSGEPFPWPGDLKKEEENAEEGG